MSERELIWSQRVEAQIAQDMVLDNMKEAKEFDAVKHNAPRHDSEAPKTQKDGKVQTMWNSACAETVPCIWQIGR